ncbi:hypothetical protein [Dactylosporangium matsuzakiense]|uniref:Uncharacterized protein n=1 Tax=Dactylosporangium matsuzakiense TaxID=53360 RepID=A0A9W6NHY3_9ACTN|nr:hypothetical protein [Dactylosporangium matsuzakiense]UWZ47211.1 hypothetical protein Dmats_12855 [Dactylosporangium matsuzakiense]GLK98344.1 hypothetical protein GCM10017581_000850 [Dactylosporangium matsuzakiense]
MIPESWTEARRDEDGELLGFLRPADDAPGRFVPVTVFGYALGEAGDEDDGRQVLEAVGLSYLADRWSLALDDRPDPISVQIVEASPEQVVVKNVDFGYEGNIGTTFRLDTPVGTRLRRG